MRDIKPSLDLIIAILKLDIERGEQNLVQSPKTELPTR
jgi:hypothetical protein